MRGERSRRTLSVITAEGEQRWFSAGIKNDCGAKLLTQLKREVLTVLYHHFLLQGTVKFPSIHVSSKVTQKNGQLLTSVTSVAFCLRFPTAAPHLHAVTAISVSYVT